MASEHQKQTPKIDKGFDPAKIEKKAAKTIKDYKLFSKGDKILVACSGGKDSNTALHVLNKLGYDVEAITINTHIGSYSEQNIRNLRSICSGLGVKVHEITFKEEFGRSLCDIQKVLRSKGQDFTNCHTCGVLRRYLLNKHSRKIMPNALATGHNLDDEAQSIMMNLLRGHMNIAARTGPTTGLLKHAKFVPRVKPLYFVEEKDIIQYSLHHGLPAKYGECPCNSEAYRRNMKAVVATLEKLDNDTKMNIAKSFLRILPKLKDKYITSEKLDSCELCGEPTNKNICNTCNLMLKTR